MSKFNTSVARPKNGEGFITASGEAGVTYNGGAGVLRDEKSELYLLGVSDFGNEGSFYESADKRYARMVGLVRTVAVADTKWIADFSAWLRGPGNMRSVSLVVALEAAKALIEAGVPGARSIVSNVLQRADEPGEALAYWHAKYGKSIPSAVKRGIADAVVRLYNEFSLGKYDSAKKAYRFGDVIRLTHPKPSDNLQEDLFNFAIVKRKDNSAKAPESLKMAQKRKEFFTLSNEEKRAAILSGNSPLMREAGLTWENVGSEIGLDGQTWDALVPTMGYMALLRNLRNLEEKGASSETLDKVADRIADPEQVAKSKQFPFRFLAAFLATTGQQEEAYGYDYYGSRRSNRFDASGSFRFAYPLEKALNASLANIPSLKGNSLILVDRSGSMWGKPSQHTKMNFADSAALFGTALALRAEKATLVQFGSGAEEIKFKKSDSVLALMRKYKSMGGTDTVGALRKFVGHGKYDRVIIITDEQYDGGSYNFGYGYGHVERMTPSTVVPASIPLYTYNLVGYGVGHEIGGNRYTFGGLTDHSFGFIPFVESGRDAKFPWEVA